MGHQIACNQGKQIRRFRPRVVPFGPACACAGRVSVGEQHGQVAFDAHCEHGHHIRAVRVVGDFAKPLGLALRAVHAVRHIQPLKGGVGRRAYFNLCFEYEGRCGDVACEAIVIQVGCDRYAVNFGTDQFKVLAVQKEISA